MFLKKLNNCNSVKSVMIAITLLASHQVLAAPYRFEVLHAFGNHNPKEVANPHSLLQAKDGNLYGLGYGYDNVDDAVFKLNLAQSLPKYSEYLRLGRDRLIASAEILTQARNGNFYVIMHSLFPGITRADFLYKITPSTPPLLSEKIANIGSDFSQPHLYRLLEGKGGKFYTTAQNNGYIDLNNNAGFFFPGTLLEIDTSKNSFNNIKVLHQFDLVNGANPYGSVINVKGVLYGTTCLSASTINGVLAPVEKGVIYRYDLNATGTKYKVIHRFDGRHGACPQGELLKASNGKLYGTARSGGYASNGVIFELDINRVTPTYRVVHYFNGNRGGHPQETLVQSTKTNSIYGVTYDGGRLNKGVLFKLDVLPRSSLFSLVHRFNGLLTGQNPKNILIGKDNNLYGIANGGPLAGGLVYRIKL